jgi:hypothetical protein
MVLWSLVAAGNADGDAADDLRDNVTTMLADPRYGTGMNMLQVGCQVSRMPEGKLSP